MSRLLAGAALIVATASGCGINLARVPPQIAALGGLVVSNSPMQGRRAAEPRMVGDHLEILYSILVENVGADHIIVELRGAKVSLSKTGGAASCSVGGQPLGILSLQRGDRHLVVCRLVLSRESTAAVQSRDEDVKLAIPVETAEGRAELSLYYWLRIEDAS